MTKQAPHLIDSFITSNSNNNNFRYFNVPTFTGTSVAPTYLTTIREIQKHDNEKAFDNNNKG